MRSRARFVSLAVITVLSTTLVGCELVGVPHERDNPRNVEDDSIPALSSGECDGREPMNAGELFADDGTLSESRPEEGVTVAFEGLPEGYLICTQKGCLRECCDNACGAFTGCAYALRPGDSTRTELCLDHPGFTCGGTDCSPFCEPFSTDPQHRYRFVGTLEYTEPPRGPMVKLIVDAFCRIEE